MTRIIIVCNLFLFLILTLPVNAQKVSDAEIRNLIEDYKKNPRGPYKDIRWFCKDGKINLPKEPCEEKGGVQRARYKDEVSSLAKTNHIFLGQILATSEFDEFWDAAANHSRTKQYQLENYLKKVDDGWVNRRGQYYRGAYQIEDEIAWGIDFLNWVLSKEEVVKSKFFLIRQAAKDIPHRPDTDRSQRIRALSKVIADEYAPFMDLRIKIHGQPEATDIKAVIAFNNQHGAKLKPAQQKQMKELIADMEAFYTPVDVGSLNPFLKQIPSSSAIHPTIKDFIENYKENTSEQEKINAIATLMLDIRKAMPVIESRKARLALLDLSNALEEIYFKTIAGWNPENPVEMMEKIYSAGMAAAGAGFLELWEWEALSVRMKNRLGKKDVEEQEAFLTDARRLVEWGAGMVRAVYNDAVELYRPFESKAYGFLDDRVRSSVLLDLGESVGTFGEMIAGDRERSNQLMNLSNASHARGLNPGVALGELVVIEEASEEMEVDKNKIYVFNRPPADLKPVAGIATVTEGNMVSHVQLLARNLAIPNAVISDQNLNDLKAFSGQKVYYSVSESGRVILKPESEMSEAESALFIKAERKLERIRVPVDRIDLSQKKVLNMRQVNASSSGVVCGPKAANLGQLKAMFPEQVVEGIVIPFGIFRAHLDQPMPGGEGSYWEFLNYTFQQSGQMERDGASEASIETFLLTELEKLREAIKKITFYPEFIQDLNNQFLDAFGQEIGKVPVFIRSDTNMEDLKDFTGAGLNLTLFNIVDTDRIIKGIKEVWASPYTERSFKWRQRYLLNPENVFPSILIIPSVDVDFSGVLITKGITSGNEEDLTLAISRGAGGAVDGQAAESYLLKADGTNVLLTPAREPSYRRLPVSGGTSSNIASFDQPIAHKENLEKIRAFAKTVETIFPEAHKSEKVNAYDVEFGFKDDKLWLFQIRPFVENIDPVSGEPAIEKEKETESPIKQKNSMWWLIIIALAAIGGFLFWKFKLQNTEAQSASNQRPVKD